MTRRPMTAEQRILRARLAAHTLHSKVDGREHTAAARAAFLDRFEQQVDPDRCLDPVERARRAEHARKAYFLDLSLKSARARQARRAS
jgi:alpha-D-ribose 1-methylphosphonate 5-triphosphate synthase subunit PhnG